MRFPVAVGVLALPAGTAACGPAGAGEPAKTTVDVGKDGRCGALGRPSRAVVAALAADDRVALEVQAKRGLVAVRFDGCAFDVLRNCRAVGSYDYVPAVRQRDRVVARGEEELRAALPLGGERLGSVLRRAGSLAVDMTIVGAYASDRAAFGADDVDGSCEGATHVITSLTVGAFRTVAGVGAALVDHAGDEATCARASGSDTRPPNGCGAPLRAELVPLGEAGASTGDARPRCTGQLVPEGTQCIESDERSEKGTDCPAGTTWNGASCAPTPKAVLAALRSSHQCKDGDVQDCTTQCSIGHPGSCAALANIYERGAGVQQDNVRAAELYEKACTGGSARGCYGLGWFFHSATGVQQNYPRAAKLYQKACAAGEAVACENLGVLHENGYGVPQDYLQAAALFKRACDWGNALGCSAIGNYFVGGWGVSVDRPKGIGLLRRGCAQGDQWGCGKLREYGETP